MKSTAGMPPVPSLQTAPSSASQLTTFQRWYAQGEALANDGAYVHALRYFEEAAILAPRDTDALVYQAVCLIHLGRPQQALAVADRILAIAPTHPQGHLYRGVALHHLGQYKESYASYAQVQVQPF